MSISPLKIPLQLDNNIEKRSEKQAFVFAVLLGVIGAFFNLFPINAIHDLPLAVGNVAFVIAAAYLRKSLTFLTAILCTLPLFFSLECPLYVVVYIAEAVFISYLRHKCWLTPTSDCLFWLLIGLPLTLCIAWFANQSISDVNVFLLLFKQVMNAVFYTSLAVVSVFFIRDKIDVHAIEQHPPLNKNFQVYINYALWISMASFIIALSFFMTSSASDKQYQQLENKLDISSQYLNRIITNYIEEHKKAISQVANTLSIIDEQHYGKVILETQQLYPGFLNIFSSDIQGNINNFVDYNLVEQNSKKEMNIAQKDYFIRAVSQNDLYVSPVLLDKTFGFEPIISISAPVYKENKIVGVVQGSLNLNLFQQVNCHAINDSEINVILTDENQNIIYAESSLVLPRLSHFQYTIDHNTLNHQLLKITQTLNNESNFYVYRKIVLKNGWQVFVLIEYEQLVSMIEEQSLVVFLSLIVIIILITLLSNIFARLINRPLEFVSKQLIHTNMSEKYQPIPYDTPTEFLTLYNELKRANIRKENHQKIIENKLNKTAHALKTATNTLVLLQDVDELTGLYNQRSLEIKFAEFQGILSRNNANMMLLIIDINNFATVKNQYGHLLADQCLSNIAKMIKATFDRRTDIVARFDDTKFVIIAQDEQAQAIEKKLTILKNEISQYRVENETHTSSTIIDACVAGIKAKASFSNTLNEWLELAKQGLQSVKTQKADSIVIKEIE